jgi:putative phage-type endonuclease
MKFEHGHANVLADAGDMSEEDWKDLRNNSVGSSDTAAVMGMGRYGSPLEVWEAKTGRHTKEMNYAMSLGHVMEPVILGLAGDEIGMPVQKPDLVLQHPEIPEMTCNLDGIATNPYGEVFIVEAKHAGSYLKSELEIWWQHGIPKQGSATEGWWVQVQQQMAVTGIENAYLAALCDKKLFVIPVARDGGFIKEMERDIPKWFQRHVEGDERPELVANDSDAVSRMYPDAVEDKDVDMKPMAMKLAKASAIKEEMRLLKADLKVIEVQIKDHMGDAAAGFIDGEQVITSKNVSTTRISTKKLRAEDPEVAEACSETSTSRRLVY